MSYYFQGFYWTRDSLELTWVFQRTLMLNLVNTTSACIGMNCSNGRSHVLEKFRGSIKGSRFFRCPLWLDQSTSKVQVAISTHAAGHTIIGKVRSGNEGITAAHRSTIFMLVMVVSDQWSWWPPSSEYIGKKVTFNSPCLLVHQQVTVLVDKAHYSRPMVLLVIFSSLCYCCNAKSETSSAGCYAPQ